MTVVLKGSTQPASARRFAKSAVPTIESQELVLTLLSRRQETANIVSFEFSVATSSGQPFRHHPGQAITVRVPLGEDEVIRTFTIASALVSPSMQNNRIVLTVKAGPNANATAHMHAHWQVGDKVMGRGPFGHFSVVHHAKQPLLLVGAGSGLTPMLSILRWLHERQEHSVDVVLLQQAATPEDILCQAELAQIDVNMPNLVRIDRVTQVPAGQSWSGIRGAITRASLRSIVPDLAKRMVFCCGPAGFTDLIRAIHKAEGGEPERFLTESFGSQSQVVVKQSLAQQDAGKIGLGESAFSIQLDGMSFSSVADESIVDSAAASGIIIPTACREGHCGTCKLKVIKGEVDMQHNGGLSAKEAAQGFILGCSSCAKTDLVLSRKF